MGKILLVGFNKERFNYFKRLLTFLQIDVSGIIDDNLSVNEAFECNYDTCLMANIETMMFDNVSNDKLYIMLKMALKQGYEYRGLLACKTENNQEWTIKQLIDELIVEHNQIHLEDKKEAYERRI